MNSRNTSLQYGVVPKGAMVGKRQRCELGARAFLDIEAEVSDEEFGSDEEIIDDEEDVGEYT